MVMKAPPTMKENDFFSHRSPVSTAARQPLLHQTGRGKLARRRRRLGTLVRRCNGVDGGAPSIVQHSLPMGEHMPILLGQKARRVASDAGAGWSQASGSALAHNNELLALASASGGRGSAQRVSHNLTTKSSHPGTPGSVFPLPRPPTPPPCSGGGEEARPHLS